MPTHIQTLKHICLNSIYTYRHVWYVCRYTIDTLSQPSFSVTYRKTGKSEWKKPKREGKWTNTRKNDKKLNENGNKFQRRSTNYIHILWVSLLRFCSLSFFSVFVFFASGESPIEVHKFSIRFFSWRFFERRLEQPWVMDSIERDYVMHTHRESKRKIEIPPFLKCYNFDKTTVVSAVATTTKFIYTHQIRKSFNANHRQCLAQSIQRK